jgi:hypothetical protein
LFLHDFDRQHTRACKGKKWLLLLKLIQLSLLPYTRAISCVSSMQEQNQCLKIAAAPFGAVVR